MADGAEEPRHELARLVDAAMLERVNAAEHALVFVLDRSNAFRYFDSELAAVYDGQDPLAVGSEFRSEFFMPSNRVSRAIASAQEGLSSEPFLVFARHSSNQSHVWHFEVFPICPEGSETPTGVLGLLRRAGERAPTPAVDPLMHAAALSERLERERLETTQAVAVTMRHEINNALTSLIGNAELILRRVDELDPQTVTRVREIAHQGRRIQTVLDRLEQLTEIRTTTYYGGVQMIELGEEDDNKAS